MPHIRPKKGKRTRPKKDEGDKKSNEEIGLNNITDLNSDLNFEKLVKDEHSRLHRRYRLMEDQQSILHLKEKALFNRSKLYDSFRREQENLDTDLYNCEAQNWKEIDRESRVSLVTILEFIERVRNETKTCRSHINEMVGNVDKILKLLLDHKLKIQVLYGKSMSVAQANKKKMVLEDRLYTYTTKQNLKFCSNRALREEINLMLKLRGLFFMRQTDLKKAIAIIKRRMFQIVLESTGIYDLRDEHTNRTHVIRDRNEKETAKHVLDIKEQHRVLAHDAQARNFVSLKNAERACLESRLQRDNRRNIKKSLELDKIIKKYSKSFKSILESSLADFHDQETLLKYYSQIEQKNFTRFVAISDINQEVELLSQEGNSLANDIEKLYMEAKLIDEDRSIELDRLWATIHAQEKDLAAHITKFDSAKVEMKESLEVLSLIFTEVKAPNSILTESLGGSQGITLENAVMYAKVIDDVGRELVSKLVTLEARKEQEVHGVNLTHKHMHASKLRRSGAGRANNDKNKNYGGPYAPEVLIGHIETDDDDGEGKGDVWYTHAYLWDKFKVKVRKEKSKTLSQNDLHSHSHSHSLISILEPTN